MTGAGLIQLGEDLFYAYNDSGKIARDTTIWVPANATNRLVPAGNYKFDVEGKMLGSADNCEVVQIDGAYYYYIDGKVVKNAGLVQAGEDYYYAYLSTGKITVNETVWLTNSNANGLVTAGGYLFDAEGKTIGSGDGEIVAIDGVLYYYVSGKPAKDVGLIQIDGYFYYVELSSGKLAVNKKLYITKTNGLLLNGSYTFDEAGRVIA